MDTWTAATKNWLIDFLPKSSGFERARIMTFGYNSTLIDRKSNDRLQDWADDLLRQIGHARGYQQSHQRPVILVCHSLVNLFTRSRDRCADTRDTGRSGRAQSDDTFEYTARKV